MVTISLLHMYELDLTIQSSIDKEDITNQVSYYKEHRHTLQFGRLYLFEDDDKLETFEVQGDETIVTKVRKLYHAVPYYERLHVKGLEDDKTFNVSDRPYQHNIKQFGNLINHLLPIKVNSEGMIVNAVSKRYVMNSAKQYYQASGSALKSGILLNSLFLGSGYKIAIRFWLRYVLD